MRVIPLEDDKLPITDHLEELRWRLIKSLIAVGLGFCVSYAFIKPIFNFFISPLVAVMPPGSRLIYTSLPEAFITNLKLAFFTGIMLAAPVIFYQLWKFVMPGLYDTERRHVIPFVLVATAFFIMGVSFAFFVVFPFGFRFFLGFSSESISAFPTLKEYLSFTTSLLLAFGVIFELPVIIFFLAKIGIVNHTMLKKQRKYAILINSIVSAVLTPPDVISMLFMMLPLQILYEFSVWVAYFVNKGKVPDSEVLPAEPE
jgi:sec-independent protein translocase protein TatC